VLRPERSEGGFRLYGREDIARVEAMTGLIERGFSAAESARIVAAEAEPDVSPFATGATTGDPRRLREALEGFDEAAAHAILDAALTSLTVDGVLERLVLPAVREIGQRWQAGEATVGQEHFATGLLRERMLALGRNWGAGVGPRALLACPPGEHHDIGLVAFGLVLRDRGWRITYLGPDTPIESVARTAADLRPRAVVLAALDTGLLEAVGDEISELSRRAPVLLGGGVDPEQAGRLGAAALDADPVRAALSLAVAPQGGG
jgi:methanogenic corrinoid protein MtbC1